MLKEFKEFAMRGNVIDLAVGVIIGGAFGRIVTSIVNDIIMPPIGLLTGQVDFASLYVNLDGNKYPSLAKAREAGAATINYGAFLNSVIDFLIVAFVIFLLVKQINRTQRPPEHPIEPTMKECPECASAIPIRARRCSFCTSVIVPQGAMTQ